MNERQRDLGERTKLFALEVIRLFSFLPRTVEARVLGRQVLRSGTSVGAHYREARRARSDAEFISKIEGGLQELEETVYWLELLAESQLVVAGKVAGLLTEAQELLAIMVSMVRNVKRRR